VLQLDQPRIERLRSLDDDLEPAVAQPPDLSRGFGTQRDDHCFPRDAEPFEHLEYSLDFGESHCSQHSRCAYIRTLGLSEAQSTIWIGRIRRPTGASLTAIPHLPG
jgi:hypothetical protein